MRTFALAILFVFCLGPNTRADISVNFSNAAKASMGFKGTGSGATFQFSSNGKGQGFQITAVNGITGTLPTYGTIGGTFSYTTSSIVTKGSQQTATVTSKNGSLSISDGNGYSLTATLAMASVSTNGTAGSLNLNSAVNLTNVSYSGTNKALLELESQIASEGGAVVTISFLTGMTLKQLAASGAVNTNSYLGSMLVAPEPSTMALAALGTMGLIGYSLRRRKARIASSSPGQSAARN